MGHQIQNFFGYRCSPNAYRISLFRAQSLCICNGNYLEFKRESVPVMKAEIGVKNVGFEKVKWERNADKFDVFLLMCHQALF